MSEFTKLMREAAIAEECGSWTTQAEIIEEIATSPDWLMVYGLDEIKVRDRVIAKLLGVEYPQGIQSVPITARRS